MATWQQGLNSGGLLAGIGQNNSNAPQASDINSTLSIIRANQEADRSGQNNVGLQALQGIQSIQQQYQQAQQQQKAQEFQQKWGQASATGDTGSMRKLFAEYPEQAKAISEGMDSISADHRESLGNLAAGFRMAAGSGAGADFVAKNAAEFNRLGIDPAQAQQIVQQDPQAAAQLADGIGMRALTPDKYFDVVDKQQGRQITARGQDIQADTARRGQDITVRGQDIGAATSRRGQDMSYSSSMSGHGLAAERLSLDKQKFGLELEQAQQKAQQLINGAPALSVNMEKSIEKSAGDAAASRNSADSMTTLAATLEQQKPTAGLFGSSENMYAKLTGQDNYLRDMRVRYNQLANAQATKLLPPGPASDKDIEFARKGIPSETDNPMVMARWLRGMAKMEEANANFNEFKSEWMSANGNPGQSKIDRNIAGMDVKKGESLNMAAKRFLSSSTAGQPVDAQQAGGTYTSKSGIQFKVE